MKSSNGLMRFIGSGACFVMATLSWGGTKGTAAVLERDFWSYDAIEWGDGRPYETPVSKTPPYPQGFKAEYRITVPGTGWYELILTGGAPCLHDLLVDGQFIYRSAMVTTGKDGDSLDKDSHKIANLWLTAGSHLLCIQSVGRPAFPMHLYGGWQLRASEGRPEGAVFAEKAGVDVMRAGETFKINLTGGGIGKPVSYELVRIDLLAPSNTPEVVSVVAFPSGKKPETKTVAIPCPVEGVFQLRARYGGKLLRPSEFRIGEYAVVDVKHTPSAGGEMTLVHDIDCVAQTDNGQPVNPATFFECNGKTRLSTSPAGKYRESNDGTGPEVEVPKSPTEFPRAYSGFAYQLDVPDEKAAYLLEIDYPDDDRRTVTVPVSFLSDKTGEKLEGDYSGKAWETGGMFPLTKTMLKHRSVLWASSHRINVGLLSQQIGHRSAAARLRLYKFPGDLPAPRVAQPDGRAFLNWYEEGDNWKYVVNARDLFRDRPAIVNDYVAMKRWIQLVRYSGMTGVAGMGIGYQGAFYRSSTLPGYMPSTYDASRLTVLLCEKYGMTYLAEAFPAQWYMDSMVLAKRVKDPEELRPYSCQGAREAAVAYNVCNALHPLVQETWINALGEMADKLCDSPAFAGIAVRMDSWQYRGQFALGSLYWGYSDWTIAQFEKETGVTVPGKLGDPQRFIERFQFLMADAMRTRWIRWRCDRTLDYHRRLRDRIRGDRKDVAFVLSGDGCGDATYERPKDVRERFLGMGIDLDRLKTEDGIAVMPCGRYGARNTTSADQAIYDDCLDPANKAAGFGRVRAFSEYMVYQELGHAMPYDKLGVKARDGYYYCSAVDAGGRHTLQKYAAVLADQDTAILRDGGNSYIYGDPDIWRPWFAEFSALPRLPFTPVPGAMDPVAVWYLDDLKSEISNLKSYYFYAVNREQYPIKVTVTLAGAKSVVRLGTGEIMALSDGKLQLDLAPYELRSFRATKGAAITAVQTEVPAERLAFVKRRLAFAQEVAEAITTGAFSADIAVAECEAYLKTLAAAWEAFGRGHVWRARTALSMAPMMVIYEKLGRMPEGQIVTRFPGLLKPKPDGYYSRGETVLGGEDLAAMLPAGAKAQIDDSHVWNGEWGGARVVRATGGLLELELETLAAGAYSLSIGHVADAAGVTTVSINGRSLSLPIVTAVPGAPETLTFPQVSVPAGKTRLTLRRDGAFGLYGVKWLPAMRPLPSELWSVVGPFKSTWGEGPGRQGFGTAGAKQGFGLVLPPETNSDLSAVFKDASGTELRWAQKRDTLRGKVDATGVDWAVRTASPSVDFNFAMMFITSPDERTVLLDLGVDWWANVWLNGQRVKSNLQAATVEAGGADFNSMRYHRGTLPLKSGVNTLLIKTQGGSMGNSFSAYLSEASDLKAGATPSR